MLGFHSISEAPISALVAVESQEQTGQVNLNAQSTISATPTLEIPVSSAITASASLSSTLSAEFSDSVTLNGLLESTLTIQLELGASALQTEAATFSADGFVEIAAKSDNSVSATLTSNGTRTINSASTIEAAGTISSKGIVEKLGQTDYQASGEFSSDTIL